MNDTNQSVDASAGTASPTAKTVAQVLAECRPDRNALKAKLDAAFKDLWTESLVCLEQALPHVKGDGSQNDRLFKAYRHRILGKGNSLSREMGDELECFVTVQMYVRETVQKIVVQGEGPFNLPAGVRMRDPLAAKAA